MVAEEVAAAVGPSTTPHPNSNQFSLVLKMFTEECFFD